MTSVFFWVLPGALTILVVYGATELFGKWAEKIMKNDDM